MQIKNKALLIGSLLDSGVVDEKDCSITITGFAVTLLL
jgi:hypothetical protein